jgi:hypothetical protein
VAIDISGKPIFDLSELEWSYVNGAPIYRNEIINLEC